MRGSKDALDTAWAQVYTMSSRSRSPRVIPTPLAMAAQSLPEHDADTSSVEHSSMSSQQHAVSSHSAARWLAPQQVTLAEPALLETALPSPLSASTVSDARADVVSIVAVAVVASPARSLGPPIIGIASRPWLQHVLPSPVSRVRGGFASIAAVAAVASPIRGRATLRQPRERSRPEAIDLAPAALVTQSSRSAGFRGHVRRLDLHPSQFRPKAPTLPLAQDLSASDRSSG